jgi:type IV pilus assembly protein PilO
MAAAGKKAKKPLSRNAKLALIVVGLLLVAALGYFLLVRPKHAEAEELDARLADLQAQIVAANSRANVKPPKVEAADLFRLAKAMPDRADMPGLLLELNAVASETGIVFKSITPGSSSPREGYQVVPISLAFEGDFYSLSDFLFRLRNLVQVRDGDLRTTGRLFSVESITFTEGVDRFPYIAAGLTVNAFVYGTAAPASEVPPAETTTGTTTTTTETTTTTTTPDPSQPAPAPAPTAAPAGGSD